MAAEVAVDAEAVMAAAAAEDAVAVGAAAAAGAAHFGGAAVAFNRTTNVLLGGAKVAAMRWSLSIAAELNECWAATWRCRHEVEA